MNNLNDLNNLNNGCLVLCTALPREGDPAALEPALRRWLDADTMARIGRLRQPVDRLRSILGRLLLRHGLRLRGCDDAAGVVIGPYGKPQLADGLVEFNLSHAGRWVVCALANAAVGIDVEQLRPFDLQLAWRFFHQRECAALAGLPAAAQHDYFFRLWTAKEAYMKALGLGFQRDMASFCVAPGADSQVALDDPQRDPQCHSRPFRLFHLDLEPGYRLALCCACAGPPVPVPLPLQVQHVTLDHLLSLTILH